MIGAEIESFGFKVTPNTMATARKHAAENGAGSPVPKPQQPPSKRPVSEDIKEEVKKYLEETSLPAANRTVKMVFLSFFFLLFSSS